MTNNIFLCVTREGAKKYRQSRSGMGGDGVQGGGGAPRQVGAILTAPSVMCVTSKPQLL